MKVAYGLTHKPMLNLLRQSVSFKNCIVLYRYPTHKILYLPGSFGVDANAYKDGCLS